MQRQKWWGERRTWKQASEQQKQPIFGSLDSQKGVKDTFPFMEWQPLHMHIQMNFKYSFLLCSGPFISVHFSFLMVAQMDSQLESM